MELLVLDEDFSAVGIVDVFSSLIWADRYFSVGDFELYSAEDQGGLLSTIKQNYYLSIPSSDHVMIVEGRGVTTDPEEGNHVIFSGRSLESILERRIVWTQTILSGNFQEGIKRLLNENAIFPTLPERRMPGLIFEPSTDPGIKELTIEAQFTGDNLLTVVESLCRERHIGWKITPTDGAENFISNKIFDWEPGEYAVSTGAKVTSVYRIRLNELVRVIPGATYIFKEPSPGYGLVARAFDADGKFVRSWGGVPNGKRTMLADEEFLGIAIYQKDTQVATSAENLALLESGVFQPGMNLVSDQFLFKLYLGKDRSYSQIENPYVVFSPKFDNILSSNYAESNRNEKTVSLVGGEGEGSERTTVIVDSESGRGEGLRRREIFTDARDLSSTVELGKNLFDKSGLEPGFIDAATGEVVENPSWPDSQYGDFIPVELGVNYYMSGYSPDLQFRQYTLEGDYVGTVGITPPAMWTSTLTGLVIPSFHAGVTQEQLDIIQIEVGTVATDYIEFGKLTEEEYNAQLSQRGKENLSENVAVTSFEGEVEATLLYKYGEDFFMGDILQITNEYNMETKARVVEFIQSQDLNGEAKYPTFEKIE